uniref:Uncharacterized protein n=1 Tax=Electrophorus electricus TaxID=8005 RepID=A0AAY5EZT5_ELEEL
IVMMTYADGFHSHSVIGITLVVASASSSALYKVLFKLVLGSAKFGEAALFLTIVGGANFIFISFVPVILYFTHIEYFGSPDSIPWAYLCGVAGLLLAFNILVNFGIAVTYPALISLGIVLSVPVNASNGGRVHLRDPLQHGAAHRRLHHLPGLPDAAAAGGLGPVPDPAGRPASQSRAARGRRETPWATRFNVPTPANRTSLEF